MNTVFNSVVRAYEVAHQTDDKVICVYQHHYRIIDKDHNKSSKKIYIHDATEFDWNGKYLK